MIKINVSESKIKQIEEKHYEYFREKRLNKLLEIKDQSKLKEKEFYSYLLNNIKEIIVGKPERLAEIKNKIKVIFPIL
jgi:ribosome-binding protein aMBF1 (putative translation factor)